jgi:primosomal replication protein N''
VSFNKIQADLIEDLL